MSQAVRKTVSEQCKEFSGDKCNQEGVHQVTCGVQQPLTSANP